MYIRVDLKCREKKFWEESLSLSGQVRFIFHSTPATGIYLFTAGPTPSSKVGTSSCSVLCPRLYLIYSKYLWGE